MNNECRESGRKYVEAGHNVIPVNDRKKPAIPTWKEYQNGSRSTIEDIEEWSKFPGVCGWAVVCGDPSGGLTVFDFDAENFFEKWCAIIGDIAKTIPVQQTGSGLYQAWVRCNLPLRNEKLAFANINGEPKLAIETRANGGYAVVAPSFCPQAEKDGKKHKQPYRVIQGDFTNIPILSDETVEELYKAARELDECGKKHKGNGIADAPKSAVKLSGKGLLHHDCDDYSHYAQKALENELARLARTPEGSRNDQLNKSSFALGQLVSTGVLDHGAVEAALSGVAASIGLTGVEIRATIHSGIEAGMKQPRQLPEKQSKSCKQKWEQKKAVPPLIKNLDIASIYAQETGLKLLTDPPQVNREGFTPCSVLYKPEDPSRTAFVNIGQGEKRGYYFEMENGRAVIGGNLCKTISEKGFGTAYVTPKDVYAYLKKTTVAKRDARGAGEQNPSSPENDTTKPIIPTSDRYLDSISNDVIKALERANHPPFLFRRSGSLVRISLDEKDTPKIIALNDVQLRGVLARHALFMKKTKAGSVPTSPPLDVVKDILHLGEWTFPALEGIVQAPVMRPDGTILVEPGYDPVTHLFYVKPADLSMPEIPENPSDSDVEGYLGYILEAIRDFPFVEDADRANALAFLISLPLRPAILGSVPMAAITKPTPGTGASLFVDIVAIIGTGKVAPMAGLPRDDDEMRKYITSRLLAGDPLISFDNLELPLWGPSLSRALTCHEWEDRILGGNTTARLPQRAVWVANGNNLKLRGDLPRRTFPIRLDAKLAKPWERENFRHSDLRSWCRRWRGGLLVSILSIARAWYVAGKPEPSRPVPVLGGFEAWAQTIGGILSFAGIEGFLENLAQFHDEADLEGPEWESFLSAWVEIIGDTPKTCQEVAAIIRKNSGFASTLPENLQDILQNPEKSFERSLGRALARKEKRPYGEKSLALHKDRVTRDKVILWKVAPL